MANGRFKATFSHIKLTSEQNPRLLEQLRDPQAGPPLITLVSNPVSKCQVYPTLFETGLHGTFRL